MTDNGRTLLKAAEPEAHDQGTPFSETGANLTPARTSSRPRPPAAGAYHASAREGSIASSSSSLGSLSGLQAPALPFVPPTRTGTTATGSTLHSPSGSISTPRKPWSRAVSSPYGVLHHYSSNASMSDSVTAHGSPTSPSKDEMTKPKYVIYYDDHDPGRWHTSAKEADDYLHDPDKPIDHEQKYSTRSVANLGTLAILILAVFMLFMGYPLLSEYHYRRHDTMDGYGLGGTNGSGQLPTGPDGMRFSLVDPDTPQDALTKSNMGINGGETWNLQFSDEFNLDGRSFYPGDDPIWEAVNLWAHGTGDYEWYDPAAVTTRDGHLEITLTQQEIKNLNFRSGQITSWNKFCYTGGYLEAAVILPGSPQVSGFWPAIWTMGNLGRANYGATTQGTWPYTYNTCDRGTLINQTDADGLGPMNAITSGGQTVYNRKYRTTNISWQPGQKLSACTCPGDDHPGPQNPDGSFVGRAAPEIDMFEAQVDGRIGGTLSLSGQFMPADEGYYLKNGTGEEYELGTVNDRPVEINVYRGNVLQESASAIALTNQDSYELSGNVWSIWGFEYAPGNDGYITWWMDGIKAFSMTAAAVGEDVLLGIAQRPIPEEPMYMIINLALSANFGDIDWDNIDYPAHMKVDYMRLYQAPGKENLGCDPEDFPTYDYIQRHIDAYTNPNLTEWGGDPAKGGYGQNWPRNRLYEDGNGCSSEPRPYPGRLRKNGLDDAPWQTVPFEYVGSTVPLTPEN